MPYAYRFTYVPNHSVKVFSKLYVGIKPQYTVDGELEAGAPLAFATPYEENAAGAKRRETVDQWLPHKVHDRVNNQWVPRNVKKNVQVVDNVPRAGFRITDDVKRVYYGGGNVVWRVEDPYGWELEIQSANLMALIQTAGLNAGGEIPGKCVWGRTGAINVLLHEDSEEYKNAIKAAETVKAKSVLGAKQRSVGSVYRLKTGQCGVYLGKLHVVAAVYDEKISGVNITVKMASTTKSCISRLNYTTMLPSEEYEGVLMLDPNTGAETDQLMLYRKANLISLEEARPELTVTDALLERLKWTFASASADNSVAFIATVRTEKVPAPKLMPRPWAEAELKKVIKDLRYSNQHNTSGHFTLESCFRSYRELVGLHLNHGYWTLQRFEDREERKNGEALIPIKIDGDELQVPLLERSVAQVPAEGGVGSAELPTAAGYEVGVARTLGDAVETLETWFREGRLVKFEVA